MAAILTAQKRILVVDDEPRICRLLEQYLGCYDFTVITETTGLGAIARVSEDAPDLLILDLKLPDIHGYEVCNQIRQHFNPWVLPILMLTAMDQPIDQLRGFAFGADAYMRKPFALEELRKTLQLLLGQNPA